MSFTLQCDEFDLNLSSSTKEFKTLQASQVSLQVTLHMLVLCTFICLALVSSQKFKWFSLLFYLTIMPNKSIIKSREGFCLWHEEHILIVEGSFEISFVGIWRVELQNGVREHQLPSSVCTGDFTFRTAAYALLWHSQDFQHTHSNPRILWLFCFIPQRNQQLVMGRGGEVEWERCLLETELFYAVRSTAKVNNRALHWFHMCGKVRNYHGTFGLGQFPIVPFLIICGKLVCFSQSSDHWARRRQ